MSSVPIVSPKTVSFTLPPPPAAIYTGDLTDLSFFQCSPPIPTVSQWGVAVLALLILSVGTIGFRQSVPSSIH